MVYLTPKKLEDAFALMARPDIRLIAGGTDFFPALGDRVSSDSLLDVTGIAEMQGIVEQGPCFRIGAAVTWTEIAKAPLPPAFRALQEAAFEVGSLQIQNAGTIGGNLCNASPAADGVPPLLALDAEVELASPAGIRRLPLDGFFLGPRKTALGPDEVLIGIVVPRLPSHANSRFHKLGSRRYLVISITMIAVILGLDAEGRIDVARIAIGACSPVARRLRELEYDLLGSRPGDTVVTSEHLSDLSPISDIRASAAYRIEVVTEQIERVIRKFLDDE